MQAKVEARVLTWAWEMLTMVGVAGWWVGLEEEETVWLLACVSTGFSRAQFSGNRVEACTLKTRFLKKMSDS